MMDPNLKWEVVQTVDTITPGRPHYSEQSRYAKTIQKNGDVGRGRRTATRSRTPTAR